MPFILLTLSLLLALSSSQAHAATWIFPKRTLISVYNNVDTLNASWTSNYQQANLKPWCKTKAGVGNSQIKYNNAVKPTGSQLVLLNYAKQNLCHFEISDIATKGATLNSPSFTIQLNNAARPQTWGAESEAAAATTPISDQDSAAAATSIPPPPPASAAATLQPVSSSSASPAISTGAGVGIGVGVAIVLVSIVSLSIFLFLRARRRPAPNTRSATPESPKPTTPQTYSARSVGSLQETQGSEIVPQELDGAPVVVRPPTASPERDQDDSVAGVSPSMQCVG